jgi:hypothetical protein
MGKQVTELDTLPSFTDTSLLPVHNGAGLKKGSLSQLANYLGTKFSNPNLLINPNFKINQRGQATYETSGASQIYSVDRWRLGKGKVTVNSDGTVTVTATGGTTNEEGYYQQQLENAISGDYTVSMEVISVSGAVRIAIDGAWQNVKSGLNVFHGITGTGAVGLQLANGASITLKWVKLEQGSIATPFVAPNPTEELMKCKRFFYKAPKVLLAYGINTGLYIRSTEVMNMRGGGTVVIVGAGDDNILRYEGNAKEIHFDESKCTASRTEGYIKVTLSPSNNLTNSKVVALDLNSVAITIDAEIY